MIKHLITTAGFLLLILIIISSFSLIGKKKRVLLYTKNGEGFVHKNIPNSIKVIKRICAENNIAVDASEDPSVFTEDNLNKYDALVFSNTNNEVFGTNDQRLAFQRYIQAGGAFVGIHSASGSEREWPWFWKMLGGKFKRHAPGQDFIVKVIDKNHPSTDFLPDKYRREKDECYYLNHLNPDIHVLLAADMTSVEDPKKGEYPFDIFGDYFPLCWFHEFDGGRQWYTALGHQIEHYDDPLFQKHILGGIKWAIDKKGKLDYSKATTKLIIK
ncbi:ThuA domain-containing protein [Fulvivirgaceae bacterium BMA10]|uniref:ThuA domain-containing protein n=1 Tax=Splendidivirga corallicola TaxID=3051826 RepID=A0ABT8KWT0_9BACT|nr:ThuA domain-containing protein [Fulvivirgaceae bacterium BMA10]